MSGWLIFIVVALVVVLGLALVAVGVLTSRRKTEQRRAEAVQLREHAAQQSPVIAESEQQAWEAQAQAERARAEAERAEREAAEAERAAHMDQARQEDALREADRIDPDAEHRP